MLYTVIFEAEVSVNVEANSQEDAEQKARTAFRWTDVEIIGTIDITPDDEEECNGQVEDR